MRTANETNRCVDVGPPSVDDQYAVTLAFERMRRALTTESPGTVARLLDDLEAVCRQRFAELDHLARSIADVNASAVELLVEHDESAKKLRRQNSALASETRSLADANADAVCLLFEREEALERARARKVKLERQAAELERRAFRDGMTDLYNFGFFVEQREREFIRARRYGHALSLVFLDIDHFKLYNDRNGHLAGDAVIKRVGAILVSSTRDADIKARVGASSFAARYGGEEFVLVLPQTPLEGANIVAERLRALVEAEPFPHGGHQPSGCVTISVGVASLTDDDVDASALTERADEALYRAKRSGRNRVCY